MCAAYDSNGYIEKLPGVPGWGAGTWAATGSDGVGFQRNDLDPIAQVIVTINGASSVPGPQPTTSVDAGDSGVPSQPVSLGTTGLCAIGLSPGWTLDSTNAGRGHVSSPGNPNAGR
jgi:hypothetical protein